MSIPMVRFIDFSKYLGTMTILIIYGCKKLEVKSFIFITDYSVLNSIFRLDYVELLNTKKG